MRVLVAGLGQRGMQWLDMLNRCSGVETVAGVDPDPGRRDDARKFLAGAERRLYPTLDHALADRSADAAIVCTPEHSHEAVTAQCMEHGLAVLVEKPIAGDIDQAKRMMASAKRHGLPLLVAQNYRYSATEQAISQALRDGLIGRPGFATCTQHRYRSPTMNYLRTHEYAQLDMAAHHFDNFRLYFDADIASVAARAHTPPWSDYRHGAATHALLTMDNGVEIAYVGSFSSQKDSFELRIEGDKGHIHFDGKKMRYHLRGAMRSHRLPQPKDVHALDKMAPPFGGMHAQLEELRRAVHGARDTTNSAINNLNTFAALLAVRRSDAEGRRIAVAEMTQSDADEGEIHV